MKNLFSIFGKKEKPQQSASNGSTQGPVKASTQVFIGIEEVRDDIILMQDFSAVVIIEVGAVNFWLLSPDEQTAVIQAYGNLLNSLSFPVQILILSKRMDISSYVKHLSEKVATQTDANLRKKLLSYQEFIKNIVKRSSVLEKRFFFAIPFSPLELGASASAKKGHNIDYVITRAKTSLYPKRDNLLRLLTRAGLKGTALQEQHIIELFYNLYNPSNTGKQLAPVKNYTEIVLST